MTRRSNRYWRVAALLALALGTTVLAGCTSGESKEGGMKLPEVWGYVAGERFAQLEVADQRGADTLVVQRVLAPADSWIVVHIDVDGMPGDRVGLKHVPKGESLNVEVPLEGATKNVIVAVHADRGTPDEFDFDMMKKMQSPDRPFFVNNKELAKAIELEGLAASPSEGSTGTARATSKDDPKGGASMDGDSSKDSDSAMGDDSSGDAEPSGEDGEMSESESEGPPAWGLLGGFLALNAVIIAFAAILKRRGAKAKLEGSSDNA